MHKIPIKKGLNLMEVSNNPIFSLNNTKIHLVKHCSLKCNFCFKIKMDQESVWDYSYSKPPQK